MTSAHLHAPGESRLTLDSALLIYTGDSADVYVTHHRADTSKKRPILLPGTPATKDQLAAIADLAAKQTSFRGFIPENVLYLAPNLFAWWTPATRRRVWFQSSGPIGDASEVTDHPPLLFIATADDWYVFALRENARPTPSTPLSQAPYFNVYDDGAICTGNVDLPSAPSADSLWRYEEAFFRSRFTHSNADRLIVRDGGSTQLWLDLLSGCDFPIHCLLDVEMTLEQLIAKLSTGA